MSNLKQIVIQLPEPCQENWEGMKPLGCGRFCSRCEKTVIDFTWMPDELVAKTMSDAKGKLCGRFTEKQLNRPLSAPDQNSNGIGSYFISKLALFLLVLQSFFSKGFAQSPPNRSTSQVYRTTTKPNKKLLSIHGTIRDHNTRKPLVGMLISVQGFDYQINSDKNGKFMFTLPDSLRGVQLIISASNLPTNDPEPTALVKDEHILFAATESKKQIQLFRYPITKLEAIVVQAPASNVIEKVYPVREERIYAGMPVMNDDFRIRLTFRQKVKRFFKTGRLK